MGEQDDKSNDTGQRDQISKTEDREQEDRNAKQEDRRAGGSQVKTGGQEGRRITSQNRRTGGQEDHKSEQKDRESRRITGQDELGGFSAWPDTGEPERRSLECWGVSERRCRTGSGRRFCA
jgi:hypothetical protein